MHGCQCRVKLLPEMGTLYLTRNASILGECLVIFDTRSVSLAGTSFEWRPGPLARL